MNEKYNVYLVSDSTGETLDRIFLSLKSQFANFEYEKKEFAFVRTEQQIDKIINECIENENSLILYTIVETKLAKYISSQSQNKKVPCFGILGNLILLPFNFPFDLACIYPFFIAKIIPSFFNASKCKLIGLPELPFKTHPPGKLQIDFPYLETKGPRIRIPALIVLRIE